MPRLRLTAQQVETLPALAGKRTAYRDSIVPGLILRVSPTGARTWVVRLQQGRGRERTLVTYTLGKTARLSLAAARDQARELLEHGIPTASGLTVGELARRALEAIELRASTRKEWERLTKVELAPALGTLPAAGLDRATVRAWIRGMAKRSRWTADHAFRVLRRFYSWAEDEELIQASPLHRVKTKAILGRLDSNDRVLSRDELRRLLGALARLRDSWVYADATLLLLLTMVRREGVLGMRRDELHELDGKAPVWIVPAGRMKSGREHLVPLSPQAVAVVRRRLAALDALAAAAAAADGDAERPAIAHLFPAGGRLTGEDVPMTWPSSWVRELREEMRCVAVDDEGHPTGPAPADARWTIHGLRHAAATQMREHLGADRDVVSLLLAHSLPGVTSVYDRAEKLAERRAALERWGEWLERLREPKPKARVVPLSRRRA